MTWLSEERSDANAWGQRRREGGLGPPSTHTHSTGDDVGARTRLPGMVRNQEETQINTKCSVKAFPRDNHRRNNTFGYYNVTHLATSKEMLSPPQAIRGSQVPFSFGPVSEVRGGGRANGG